MRIGVVGVGRMGAPIARRLADAGHEVVVNDADAAAAVGFATAGIRELAEGSEVLLTVLPGTPELVSVAAWLGGFDGVWIDLTSADPRAVAELAAGRAFVGAPMSGGPDAAASGTLRFSAGGNADAVVVAREVLAPLGEVVELGPDAASGYTVKLLANLLWFGQSIAAAEALLLGQRVGLDPAALRALLADSPGSSAYLERWAPRLLEGDYLPDFGIDRVVEELDAITGLAADFGIPFELSELVARLHREALDRFGPVDGELLATALLEERAGRLLRGR
jgi:3-hydroxyisobutyrate dehydrogenase-like beta-hydroxyacid dehydrogenase